MREGKAKWVCMQAFTYNQACIPFKNSFFSFSYFSVYSVYYRIFIKFVLYFVWNAFSTRPASSFSCSSYSLYTCAHVCCCYLLLDGMLSNWNLLGHGPLTRSRNKYAWRNVVCYTPTTTQFRSKQASSSTPSFLPVRVCFDSIYLFYALFSL